MKLRDLFMPVDSATLSDYDLCKAAPEHWGMVDSSTRHGPSSCRNSPVIKLKKSR